MKIKFECEVNPKEYQIEDTKEAHMSLAKEMLLGRADMPNEIKITVMDEVTFIVGKKS